MNADADIVLTLGTVARALELLGVQKLRWYRLGGEVSERQWRDIVSMLRLSTELDRGYLDRTAESARLDALLERAQSDAGLEGDA